MMTITRYLLTRPNAYGYNIEPVSVEPGFPLKGTYASEAEAAKAAMAEIWFRKGLLDGELVRLQDLVEGGHGRRMRQLYGSLPPSLQQLAPPRQAS